MDDLLRDFLQEAAENLEVVDAQLVKFERDPKNREALDHIFRLFHNLKGACGYFGLKRLSAIAHAGEALLGKFRNRSLEVTQASVSLALSAVDAIRSILDSLEGEGREPSGDDSALIARLDRAAAGTGETSESPPPSASSRESETRSQTGNVAESIRVNIALLDDLMTRVSELVLTRNQLLEMLRHAGDSEFTTPLQRLSVVTAELQTGVTRTRMQPIGNAWAKLPRLVRDIAASLGKEIELRMTGADTELDRQVLELIKDPLTHMVRNAADHGIEPPDLRVAAGKKPSGTIALSAYHEGGRIVIAVSDDGRGLDLARIRARAVEKGLVGQAESMRLMESQIARFIFQPGVSTAQKVTDLSGRGVGMDVVRSNIELIGGAIDLKTKPGQGTDIVITIPLTLAIVPVLILNAGGQRFAIPQLAVTELVRATPKSAHRIETINGAALLRLRDRLLPIVHLAQALEFAPELQDHSVLDTHVVVIACGGREFGLAVEGVSETQEIVIKPLSAALRDLSFYSGNTILGDGSVVMILDPVGLALLIEGGSEDVAPLKLKPQESADSFAQSFLLFTAGSARPKAIPLSLVTRLQEIEASRIEDSGGRQVVQYCGRLMPVVGLEQSADAKSSGKRPAIVFSRGRDHVAILVDRILDIVEEATCLELAAAKPGTVGTAVLQGKATEIVDPAYYLDEIFASWFSVRGAGAAPGQAP